MRPARPRISATVAAVGLRRPRGNPASTLALPFVVFLGRTGSVPVAETLSQTASRTAVRNSLLTAPVATAIATVLGVPLAYVLARETFRGSGSSRRSSCSRSSSHRSSSGAMLLSVVGRFTPIGAAATRVGVPLTDSLLGVVLAQTFVAAPFVVITARAGFGAVDERLEQASRSLGYGPLATFRRVSLPPREPSDRRRRRTHVRASHRRVRRHDDGRVQPSDDADAHGSTSSPAVSTRSSRSRSPCWRSRSSWSSRYNGSPGFRPWWSDDPRTRRTESSVQERACPRRRVARPQRWRARRAARAERLREDDRRQAIAGHLDPTAGQVPAGPMSPVSRRRTGTSGSSFSDRRCTRT